MGVIDAINQFLINLRLFLKGLDVSVEPLIAEIILIDLLLCLRFIENLEVYFEVVKVC